jgi:2-keto-3-deoxy-galactonokinase
MSERVLDLLRSDKGAMVSSVVLGLGLACTFRYKCIGDACVVVTAPDLATLQSSVYEMDGRCYKYTPTSTACQAPRVPST